MTVFEDHQKENRHNTIQNVAIFDWMCTWWNASSKSLQSDLHGLWLVDSMNMQGTVQYLPLIIQRDPRPFEPVHLRSDRQRRSLWQDSARNNQIRSHLNDESWIAVEQTLPYGRVHPLETQATHSWDTETYMIHSVDPFLSFSSACCLFARIIVHAIGYHLGHLRVCLQSISLPVRSPTCAPIYLST